MGRINTLIESANERLTIISPYLEPGINMEKLLLRKAEEIPVELVFREDKLSEYSKERWFKTLADSNAELFVVERLHSKIYANEQQVMIGSANFRVDSWANSRECMVVVDLLSDVGDSVARYIQGLLDDAKPVDGSRSRTRANVRSTRSSPSSKQARREEGFCIRCGDSIPFNVDRPYCKADYERWAEYQNPNFKDKQCHKCGSPTAATMSKPLCRDCFSS